MILSPWAIRNQIQSESARTLVAGPRVARGRRLSDWLFADRGGAPATLNLGWSWILNPAFLQCKTLLAVDKILETDNERSRTEDCHTRRHFVERDMRGTQHLVKNSVLQRYPLRAATSTASGAAPCRAAPSAMYRYEGSRHFCPPRWIPPLSRLVLAMSTCQGKDCLPPPPEAAISPALVHRRGEAAVWLSRSWRVQLAPSNHISRRWSCGHVALWRVFTRFDCFFCLSYFRPVQLRSSVLAVSAS